jgi:hypothetical protein
MKIICRYCGKEIGDFNKDSKAKLKKLGTYDMYYFCPDGSGCVKNYIEHNETPKKDCPECGAENEVNKKCSQCEMEIN